MFISPCSLRSTQCAALIALAAAAGITRVDAANANDLRTGSSTASNLVALLASPRAGVFELSSGVPAPWLRSFATFAAWCLGVSDASPPRLSSGNTQPDDAPLTPAAAADLISLPVAGPLCSITRPLPAPLLAHLCCIPHLLPLAVGPPPALRHHSPIAVGTPVPGDSTANGCTDLKVAAPDEASSDARLARLLFPHPAAVGLLPSPRRSTPGPHASRRRASGHRLPRATASAFRP